jgi:dTDP-D-glucose 4,6-dehydratase
LKTVIIIGGAGFIGSAAIRHLINTSDYRVVNCDKLSYAGNLESLESVTESPKYLIVVNESPAQAKPPLQNNKKHRRRKKKRR